MAQINQENKRNCIRAILPEVRQLVSPCKVCGHACGVDRAGDGIGGCRAGVGNGDVVRWQAAVPHFGEEPMLAGRSGSGTVFFRIAVCA